MHTRVQIDGYDPVAAAPVTLFAVSHDEPNACHVGGGTWWPALSKLPVLRYDLFDGAFGGQITAPSSSLTLRTEPWPNFARYALADARLRLWTGDADANSWTLRFDGRVTAQPNIAEGAAEIAFAVDDRWLDTALLATYAGTTGVEGPAAMKGQAKPLALGAPRYVPGKLIDSVNNVFQVSAYGLIEGFEAALEKLARFGASLGDYATYAALIAATIPAGTWATCNAAGLARFGAPPVGQISFLLKGDKAGPDGWARKPGQLIRRIALLSGGAGKINDAALNALDVARPYNLSLYLDNQTTARELIQSIAASVNAVAGVSWTGQLFIVPVGLASPTVTFAADGSALPAVTAVEQIDIAPPWKSLAIGAARVWQVHALADIAFTATLVDMGNYASGTTYREGNIVQDQDSSWLYINTTPGSGHAPPTLPTTSNAWWKVLAGKGVNAKQITLSVSPRTFRYDSSGAIIPQTITYAVARQNTTASVTWRVLDKAGTDLTGALSATALAATGFWARVNDDTVTMSHSQFAAFIAGAPARETLTMVVEANDGGPLSARESISKVADGADGNWRDTKFKRSISQPATPTGDNPAGWADAVPPGQDTLWQILGDKTFDGALIDVWTTPGSISGLVSRGAYDAGGSYFLNNLVTYNGGTYAAVQDNFSGHAPTGTDQGNAYWDVYAAPGAPGTPATPPSAFSATINLSSGAAINLRTVANANGYTGASNATVTFRVPSGVSIIGLSSGIGIDTGTWPAGYTITLALVVQNGGLVYGGGGNGGTGGGGAGAAGGDAIYCRENLTVTIDSGGVVKAGGGGGGGGDTTGSGKLGGGGGGGGAPNGAGGAGDTGSVSTGSDGSDGGTGGGGAAGSPRGGAGGTFATAGTSGSTGGPGGAAGYAVRKNGKTVPVTNNGTMTGTAA